MFASFGGLSVSFAPSSPTLGFARSSRPNLAITRAPASLMRTLLRGPRGIPTTVNKKRYAMNVVVSGKTIAIAADEVTASGERIPLTNFEAWPLETKKEDEAERLDKFESLLESRLLADNERQSILQEAKQILKILRDQPQSEALQVLVNKIENIKIRDAAELRG
eukprot:1227978-Amorphochlora_amoeboformis.AAC.2